MAAWVASFQTMSIADVLAWSFGVNLLLFVGAIVVGELAVAVFRDRRCSAPAPPLTRWEAALAGSCVVLNSLVMAAGVQLWQHGVVEVLLESPWWRPLLDVAVFLTVMDFAMYVAHRIAHVRWIYPWVHQTHHQHENPRPLTLFVLNPFEVLAFGGLWLAVISVYPSSWQGMMIYLAINLFFGAMGHLGVEPFPRGWQGNPWTGWISTSSFHAGHHHDANHNFGFYSLIWDRLFGTLSPSSETSRTPNS